MIALVGILLTFSVQRTQITTSQTQASAQLDFAKIQAESQKRLQESELTAKLSDSIASSDPKKREVAIIALQRSVPADTYEAVLQVLLRSDSDGKVREEAIKRLSYSTNSDVIDVLNDVERDSTRPERERRLARKAARNVSLFSDLPQATYIISAAAPGYMVADSSKYGGGLFTNYLAEGLGGKADENGDNIVLASELYQYIQSQLQYDSVDKNDAFGKQVPFMAATRGFNPQVVPPARKSSRLYGVIVGISNYKVGFDLQNADKDAKRIHEVLSKTYHTDSGEFVLLTNHRATRRIWISSTATKKPCANRAKEAPYLIREAWLGTSWIVEVATTGTRDSKPFNAKHLFLTSLRTTPKALLRLVRDRWSIEGWHWFRDTQFHEDAHRYRGNGAGVMGSLRTAALNLLRLPGFQSIRSGMQSVMHNIGELDIGELVGMARLRHDRGTH